VGGGGAASPRARPCSSRFWAPEDGDTVDEIRRLANTGIDVFTALAVTIDGDAVVDPFAYRTQSPPGGFQLPFGPLMGDFGFPPTPDPRDPAVADGYWMLLSPFSRGEHVINIRSSAPNFTLDVTYTLTVGPSR
jgi:hypothetical protein